MLKDAYKSSGLTVGHMAESGTGEPEGYYAAGSWWVMWFDKAKMPKEVKGALVELSIIYPTPLKNAITDSG